MAAEQVRMWRPADEDRVLLMAGQTTRYAIEPRGEYVFGVVTEQPMRSRRGHERRVVLPGQLVAWDPSSAHAGVADDALPEPVIPDQRLAGDFLALHTALETPTTRLERDERLAEWLRALIERSPAGRPKRSPLSPRDDKALRLACDYLGDRPDRNVSLDELATAAGIGKFRLVRLLRQRTGLPPHALQLAHRIRIARRLLEAGETIAEAAATTGFADQSHLHRHFQRSLGMTPAEYQRRFNA